MIALGGVATGSMKAKLHPIALPNTGGRGFTEAALDTAMIIGMIMFADAEDASETHGEPAPAYVSTDEGKTWQVYLEKLYKDNHLG